MIKLAIISTHPIQYNAPCFKLLGSSKIIALKVFYTWSQSEKGNKYDPGFGKNIEWDIPLLDGYAFEFVPNSSKNPGTRHHKGIVNPGLVKAIEQFKPDALLVFGWNFDSHLKAMRYFKRKIPVLFRGDSTLIDPIAGIKSVFRKLVLSWVFKHIDTALYVGSANKAYFKQNGLKEQQLLNVPHAIDNSRFEANDLQIEAAQKLREELGILPSDTLLLFAGKLEPKKDPFIIINAVKRLSQKNINLLIVGNGILETSLKNAAAGFSNIHFLDFQNQQQMPVIYAMADLVLLPSKGPGETWGLAINEAMAACKAVLVSSACGCAQDLVDNSVNGWQFKAGKEDELVAIIKQHGADKHLLQKMGQEGKRMIEPYNFDRIVKTIEQHLLTNIHTNKI